MILEKEQELNIEDNIYDKITSITKSLSSALVPLVGTAIGELLSYFIPNQRLDRVCKYLGILNEKISELSEEIKRNKEKINLIDTGMRFSSNATFDQKCQWLANIVIQGLENKLEIPIADNIINIVSELNYEQIIILYYYTAYYRLNWVEKRKFTSKFPDLFDFSSLVSKDRQKYDTLKIKEKYNITTLLKLGLLENSIDIKNLSGYSISGSDPKKDISSLREQIKDFHKNISDYFHNDDYKPTDLGNLVISTMQINEETL